MPYPFSHLLSAWNKKMYQNLETGKLKSHAEDGKVEKQKKPDFLMPSGWALQVLDYLCPDLMV